MAKANAKMLALTRRLNLHYVTREQLTIERRRTEQGGFTYWTAEGGQIDDPEMLRRFASLAVPPAYENVRYSRDARAATRPDGCNIATIRTGRKSVKLRKPNGWLHWQQ
jgi:DNA topoisomerase-1